MIGREFKINLKTFRRRKLTLLQHKLRVVMKCYTVNNFVLNETTNTFSFQKTFKKSGIQINDTTVNTGRYETIDIPESEDIILKIYVD
jgi:hypothetical protein